MLKNRFLVYLAFTLLAVTGCAKRGTVSGGAIDTIPPVIVRSSPDNMSTNFNGSQIRIDFSEYIKIKDVNKQLIISPPMETQPDIMPLGNASRYITIKIKDTLQPNTTYSFNFGQSITDNNEGNAYSQFKFVFSTGAYIDSLTLNGTIRDAYEKKADNFVTVMLYEANEKFNDSTIYKERPRYVTNTLDSLTKYSLQNLKEGSYYLVALKDKNNNYRYDAKSDKIGFLKNPVRVPTDTLYALELFMQQPAFKAQRPSQASSGRLVMGFEGDVKGLKAEVKNGEQAVPSVVTKFADKDSVQIWIPRNLAADSLQVGVSKGDYTNNFNVKIKEMKTADSLSVDAVQKGLLNFRETFTLTASTPITAIDSTKIRIINKDSTAVAFTTRYRPYDQQLELDFAKQEEEKYTITLLPGALRDFYDTENDSLKYSLATRALTDYGNLRITLQNPKRFPLLLEVLNAKGEVKASFYTEKETQVNFDALLPDKYTLRVIYDDNKNGVWDSGNYLEKRQPEEVFYYPGEIDVRANWDVEQSFNLGG